MADEGGKGQHDDVVGGKHRQHRHQDVEQEEQGDLAPFGLGQHLMGQQAEEADLVQVDRHHGHGEEQQQDLDGVDVSRGGQPRGNLGGGNEASDHQRDRSQKGGQPENADLFSTDHHRGLGEHQGNQGGTGHQKENENGDGGGHEETYLS